MWTTTDYGSFYNYANAPSVAQYVVEECNGGDSSWMERMEATGAFDRIAADFSDAIDEALPEEVHLVGDEFVGPAYEEDCTWEGDLDISEIVRSIDFWAIVERHDVDTARYEVGTSTPEKAAETADEIRRAVTEAGAVELDGTTVRFGAEVYGDLLQAYDRDADEQTPPFIYGNQLTTSSGFSNISTCN